MPVTELVFVHPSPDPQLRKEFDAKLPVALKGAFSNLPKLDVLYIGSKPYGKSNDTQQQPEICLFLQWQHISGFESFVKSPEFGKFMESMIPYVAGPGDIQLYESPEDGLSRATGNPLYLHIMKSPPIAEGTESNSSQRAAIKSEWDAFIERSRLASGSNNSLDFSLNGFGLGKDNGAFLSLVGWKDHELIDQILNDQDVKYRLQRLQGEAGNSNWDHFVYKTQQVALDK